MGPKDLSINSFTYNLPEGKIAFHPLPHRDGSKLLVYKNGQITDGAFKNIANYLPNWSLMVFNNTQVVEARLLFKKPTGGTIEVFCLSPHEAYPDLTKAMAQTRSVKWLCLIGGASKWKKGLVPEILLHFHNRELALRASYLEKRPDCFVVRFDWDDPTISFAEILHRAGKIPLPPYIKREVAPEDKERYQTTYSRWDGSVAAPTAGLHFTAETFRRLQEKNISCQFVTLHVGAGTFKPVHAETMAGHDMHAEAFVVSRAFIENLINNVEKPVIAVGTTSLRTLETLYWMGVKLLENKKAYDNRPLFLSQWEAYERDTVPHHPVKDALQAIVGYLNEKGLSHLAAKTQILIAPGYSCKIAHALVTNFHQPASTLLLLVAAFIGEDWRKVYDHALASDYRFLSYGDSSLLWRQT